MSWILLITSGLAVFFVRDALLLARSPHRAVAALYAIGAAGVFALLGAATETISRDQAFALLREPRVWVPAVLIHAVYWLAAFLARRSRLLPPWAMLALPSPVYVFSAGGLAWLALQRVSGVDGWLAGALTGLAWSAAVVLASHLAARGSWNATEFAATANLTAILLIPLQQQGGETAAPGAAPVDWLAGLLPLAAVGSLVALSFAYHRYRSFRHAAHP